MRYIIYFIMTIFLSVNTAFANDYKWQNLTSKEELGAVFSLVAVEATKLNISDFDYLNMYQSTAKGVLFYKFDIKANKIKTEETQNEKPTCDTVIVKVDGNKPTLVKWEIQQCNNQKINN